jgi:two-component system cell cycle sensor histidine kinase/response regulator CckA
MHHRDRTSAAAQRAALLFFVAGLLAILNSFRPAIQTSQSTFIALGALDLVIAAFVRCLPWQRWHARVLLVVVPVAFVVIGLFELTGAQTPYTYPIFFILVFIWVGLSAPPRTALLLLPLTAAAYVVPLLIAGASPTAFESVFVAVPACVLIGEIIARVVSQLHAAQDALEQRVAERTAQLQAANTALQHQLAERKQLEAQFLQAQKLEGIGQLAGGIAHDFNNLLTAISGYADLIWDALPHDQPVRSDLAEIQKAVTRASDLTRQLLAFARKQIIEPRVLNLNDLIGDMDKLLRRVIGEDIGLISVPDPDLGLVKADPGQIEQVIMNLAVNARDAMPGGGKLTIETRNVFLDSSYAHEHQGVIEGSYALLAVSDTGIGMDSDVQAHAFEPFFTTKAQGKGTGLGLATCYGIVKQHGGNIWVYSEVGQGTTFKIYLPHVHETAAVPPAQVPPQILARGKETLLVVEDEPAVRDLITRVLRAQGYRVLEASNGAEAIRVAEASAPAMIDLLLTDLVMPELGGLAAAAQLSAHNAVMKVLFISGYTDSAIVHQGRLEEGVAFLHKPFTPAVLTRKVREVLDS